MFKAEKEITVDFVLLMSYISIFVVIVGIIWKLFDHSVVIEYPYHLI